LVMLVVVSELGSYSRRLSSYWSRVKKRLGEAYFKTVLYVHFSHKISILVFKETSLGRALASLVIRHSIAKGANVEVYQALKVNPENIVSNAPSRITASLTYEV